MSVCLSICPIASSPLSPLVLPPSPHIPSPFLPAFTPQSLHTKSSFIFSSCILLLPLYLASPVTTAADDDDDDYGVMASLPDGGKQCPGDRWNHQPKQQLLQPPLDPCYRSDHSIHHHPFSHITIATKAISITALSFLHYPTSKNLLSHSPQSLSGYARFYKGAKLIAS